MEQEDCQNEEEQFEEGQDYSEYDGVQDCPGCDSFVRCAVPLHGLVEAYSEEFRPYNLNCQFKK